MTEVIDGVRYVDSACVRCGVPMSVAYEALFSAHRARWPKCRECYAEDDPWFRFLTPEKQMRALSEGEWPSPGGPAYSGLVKAGKTDAKSTPKIGTSSSPSESAKDSA